ncbi:MAG: hypothetical protein Q7R99_02395, partial [bacterium]|nr:hypothetical protein [bacterium]
LNKISISNLSASLMWLPFLFSLFSIFCLFIWRYSISPSVRFQTGIQVIITILDTTSGTANLPTFGLLPTGWVSMNVASYPLTVGESTIETTLIDVSSSSNFPTFSTSSFVDFERKFLSGLTLFNDNRFPPNTYGINLANALHDIVGSSTLTAVQKSVITLAMDRQNRGDYVIIAVSDADNQTTFKDFLQSYNIQFATPEEIQRRIK